MTRNRSALAVLAALASAGVLAAISHDGAGSGSPTSVTTLLSQGCDDGACESFPLGRADVGSIVATTSDSSTSPAGLWAGRGAGAPSSAESAGRATCS